MALTVGLIALVGVVGLGLPLGAAILLGAILAPTDPVLASDVQVTDPTDRDRLRFALTGEAGLNDGTAFPFVMLGLGLLGLHELGDGGWRWLAIDVVWAVAAAWRSAALLGSSSARLVLYLRRTHKEAVGLDDFLALGLIALSYGTALLAHTYGFLAVFAAGLALRRVERIASGELAPGGGHGGRRGGRGEGRPTRRRPPATWPQAVLGFNEQLERILEVGWSCSSAACSRSAPSRPRRSGSSRCCSWSSDRLRSSLGLLGSRVAACQRRSSAGSASGASVRSTT